MSDIACDCKGPCEHDEAVAKAIGAHNERAANFVENLRYPIVQCSECLADSTDDPTLRLSLGRACPYCGDGLVRAISDFT